MDDVSGRRDFTARQWSRRVYTTDSVRGGGFLASGIPFLCVFLGLDPAVIAAPAMTTFVDVSGLTSYFFIARRVFRWFSVEF